MTEAELTTLEEKVERAVFAHEHAAHLVGGLGLCVEMEPFDVLARAAKLWLQDRRAARGGDADA